jgi:hypothetical protein
MKAAESSDERTIDTVCLCPHHLALRKGLDPSGIHEAHDVSRVAQRDRYRFTSATRGF